jgi:hypothetical protein
MKIRVTRLISETIVIDLPHNPNPLLSGEDQFQLVERLKETALDVSLEHVITEWESEIVEMTAEVVDEP